MFRERGREHSFYLVPAVMLVSDQQPTPASLEELRFPPAPFGSGRSRFPGGNFKLGLI